MSSQNLDVQLRSQRTRTALIFKIYIKFASKKKYEEKNGEIDLKKICGLPPTKTRLEPKYKSLTSFYDQQNIQIQSETLKIIKQSCQQNLQIHQLSKTLGKCFCYLAKLCSEELHKYEGKNKRIKQSKQRIRRRNFFLQVKDTERYEIQKDSFQGHYKIKRRGQVDRELIENQRKYPRRKLIKKQKKKKKRAKWQIEGKPRPPVNAFMLFLKQQKSQIMRQNPQLSPSQVTTHASLLWNGFTQDRKSPYRKQYQKNKQEYDRLKQKLSQKRNRLQGENIVRISDSEDDEGDDEFQL